MSISSSASSPGLLQQRACDHAAHAAIAGCACWILPCPAGALRAPRGVAWCVACAGARDDPRADGHGAGGAGGAGHGQPQGLGGAALAAGIACAAWRNTKWRIGSNGLHMLRSGCTMLHILFSSRLGARLFVDFQFIMDFPDKQMGLCFAEVQSTWRNRGLQHTSDSTQVRPNGSDGLSKSLVPLGALYQHGHGTSLVSTGKYIV